MIAAKAAPVDLQAARALFAVFGAALAALAGAWYFELALNLLPCKLCLQQRIPYYIALPVALAGLGAMWRGRPDLARGALALLALVFLVSAGLGIYHSGVEWGFWPGPADCGGRLNAGPASAGNLLETLRATRVVSCTEAAWRFAGLSLAGWNAVISGGLALLSASSVLKR